jgi:hypothetical protein
MLLALVICSPVAIGQTGRSDSRSSLFAQQELQIFVNVHEMPNRFRTGIKFSTAIEQSTLYKAGRWMTPYERSHSSDHH